jgi:putative spermidine/putrescine transport system ATP-binding protein
LVRARGPVKGKPAERRALALRPEALRVGPATEGANSLRGAVEDVTFLGAIVRLRVRLAEGTLIVDTFNSSAAPAAALGQEVEISFDRDDLIVLDPE